MPDRLLDRTETGKRLGFSARYVQDNEAKLAAKGLLPIRLGRNVRYPESEVEKLVEKLKKKKRFECLPSITA